MRVRVRVRISHEFYGAGAGAGAAVPKSLVRVRVLGGGEKKKFCLSLQKPDVFKEIICILITVSLTGG